MSISSIICVGETLWDVLPHGEFLGGAPLNVAAHLTRLGVRAGMVSRIGTDDRGRRALQRIESIGLDTSLVQLDPQWPTGIAEAVLDATGAASYRFPQPCAWDALQATEAAIEAAHNSIVIFGTLAQRSATARDAITRILEVASVRVCDANLRAPHVDREIALASLRHADFVKLNEEEVRIFADWLGVPGRPESLWETLSRQFGLRSFCVTEGERGACLWHEGIYVAQPAQPTQVADTIGAGDSFLAMLIVELFEGSAPSTAMERASRLAAYVASQPGATPDYDPSAFRGELQP